MDPITLKAVNAARRERKACILVTDLADGRDRFIEGSSAIAVTGEMGIAVQNALRSGKSATVEVEGHAFFLNVYVPSLRIVVVGAVHISQALSNIAKSLGFGIEIIDPRTAFATPERFPDVPLYAQWPDEVLAAHPLDKCTALVAVTHDPKIDDFPLISAIKADCLYVGALGSRKTHAKRVERLRCTGLTESQISKIASPVGLDIGASGPAEIAIAIMAEIIATLRHPD